MIRKAFFQLHWLLGITAGLVLALMGITGATLTFEDEILRVLNPGVVTVQPRGEAPLAPTDLLTRAYATKSDRRISMLAVSSDPGDSARIVFAAPAGQRARSETQYLDPYTGVLLGQARGDATLHFLEDLHRKLAAGDTGKAVTGVCAIVLVFMALSGLYLRWPRYRALDWRKWLTFNTRFRGRGFLWGMHQTVGTWVLPFYLLSALSGLYFSYDWYRNAVYALAGVPPPPPRPARPAGSGEKAAATKPIPPPPDVGPAWSRFRQEVPGFSTASLKLPEKPDQPLQLTYLDPDPPHDRAFNRMDLNLATGEVKKRERYVDKTVGGKLIAGMFPLHSGSFFGLPGRILVFLASILMPLFAVTGWMMYLARRRISARTSIPKRTLAPDQLTS